MSSATVNEIFRQYGEVYRNSHPSMPLINRKVMRSIELCRTEYLGGRIESCDSCGHTVTLYNSCRNRHCPQCQNMKKEKWVLERNEDVLPFTYFHVVFTIPDELNAVALRNKRIFYNLMFRICRETLLSVCAQEKYFGADIGFFAILHTWGQKLNLHPHLHCVVPGGGFSPKKKKWIRAPNNFLVPVQVLKKRFRSLFLTELKRLQKENALYLAGTKYENPIAFQQLIDFLFASEWVVYLKESFQNNRSVIEYLSRYTHKIAISNHRIESMDNGFVSFKYRDYKDGNKQKTARMDAQSFIHRFMLHVTPFRFVRIRYFGILSHRNKGKAIAACRDFYGITLTAKAVSFDWRELFLEKTGRDCSLCPVCKTGKLSTITFIPSKPYRAPP
jgi:hypothetical protein